MIYSCISVQDIEIFVFPKFICLDRIHECDEFLSLIGAFLIGFIDSFLTTLATAEIAYIMGFAAVFIILVFKPAGLFGQEWED